MKRRERGTFFGPIPSDRGKERPLVFCQVSTTGAEVAEVEISPTSSYTVVGSIVLSVRKVKVTNLTSFSPLNSRRDEMVVHEKSKPEGARSTMSRQEDCNFCNYDNLDEADNVPFLKFVFRYRPRDLRVANGNDGAASQNREESQELQERNNEPDSQTGDYDVELLEVEAQEAAAEAQKATAHAALLAAKAKKAALLQLKSKGKGKRTSSGKVEPEEGVIDLTDL
ncbi:hypothetical protein FRC03_001395 [Tulasnella sp. 419]|nr:hypothetical protein FRC03_001395 [Tulasnella sp. 419]